MHHWTSGLWRHWMWHWLCANCDHFTLCFCFLFSPFPLPSCLASHPYYHNHHYLLFHQLSWGDCMGDRILKSKNSFHRYLFFFLFFFSFLHLYLFPFISWSFSSCSLFVRVLIICWVHCRSFWSCCAFCTRWRALRTSQSLMGSQGLWMVTASVMRTRLVRCVERQLRIWL